MHLKEPKDIEVFLILLRQIEAAAEQRLRLMRKLKEIVYDSSMQLENGEKLMEADGLGKMTIVFVGLAVFFVWLRILVPEVTIRHKFF